MSTLRGPRLFISLLVNRTFLNTQISLGRWTCCLIVPGPAAVGLKTLSNRGSLEQQMKVKRNWEWRYYIDHSNSLDVSASSLVPRKRNSTPTYGAHGPLKFHIFHLSSRRLLCPGGARLMAHWQGRNSAESPLSPKRCCCKQLSKAA